MPTLKLKFYRDKMLKSKPYLHFFIFALIMSICWLISSNERTLDINIHDTYYVTTEKDLAIVFLLFTAVLGIVYLLFDLLKIPFFSMLSKIHIYGTLLLFFVFFIYYFIMQLTMNQEQYYSITNFPEDYSLELFIVLLMIIMAQLLFIINIFVSIIKKLCNSAT